MFVRNLCVSTQTKILPFGRIRRCNFQKAHFHSNLENNSPSKLAKLLDVSIFPTHVLGAGSIGILYASALHHAYYLKQNIDTGDGNELFHPVTLLMRSHHEQYLKRFESGKDKNGNGRRILFAPVRVLKKTSTSIYDPSGNVNNVRKCEIPVELMYEPTNNSSGEGLQNYQESPINCILLCTKANDAIPALTSVSDRLLRQPSSASGGTFANITHSPKIIILSNGALAIRDAINEQFHRPNIRNGFQINLATTTHGAHKSNSSIHGVCTRYCITHAGEGETYSTNAEFIQACQSVGWKGSIVSELDMNVILWKKLAVNCVINPLTAIHNVKNGKLLRMGSSLESVMKNVLEEVSAVAMQSVIAESISKLGEHDGSSDAWLQSTKQQLSVQALQHFVTNVMSDTAANISSMLQDVKSKRVTEVQFLNGYVSSLGQNKFGIECPRNMELCHRVENLF